RIAAARPRVAPSRGMGKVVPGTALPRRSTSRASSPTKDSIRARRAPREDSTSGVSSLAKRLPQRGQDRASDGSCARQRSQTRSKRGLLTVVSTADDNTIDATLPRRGAAYPPLPCQLPAGSYDRRWKRGKVSAPIGRSHLW